MLKYVYIGPDKPTSTTENGITYLMCDQCPRINALRLDGKNYCVLHGLEAGYLKEK